MRIGLPISIVLHLAILIWAAISIGSAKPPVVPEAIPVTVALLTAAEFNNIRKGSETSKDKTTAAKPKDGEPVDAPLVKAKRKAEVAPPPPKAEPEPAKVEPPKPEPPKPEPPKPEPPKPEPKTLEPAKPDPIAEQLAKPEPPKTPDPPKAEPPKPDPIAEQLKKLALLDPPLKKEPAKKPALKTEQQVAATTTPVKTPKKKGLDINKLQAQINLLPDAAPDAGSDATPDPAAKTQAAAVGVKKPTGTQLSATEQQMFLGTFSNKVSGCWTVLAGAADARDVVVPVHFELNPDGSLKADPVVTSAGASPSFGLAAENVVRAIRQCAPYQLPPAQYAKWQTWDIDFDPRAMFGG